MTDRRLLERCITKYRILFQPRLRSSRIISEILTDKTGLEIGGPSEIFRRERMLPVYRTARQIDNCDFSSKTTWADHHDAFIFSPEKPAGQNIFCDGSNLETVPNKSYQFVLSSHNLEHFANPVKALKEWQRVLVANGVLVLVLPNYQYTFDHRRQPTTVEHMFEDLERNTPETDLTHLPDILANHDLSRDPGAGTPEEFKKRSLSNFENRCLHHHVFSPQNTEKLLIALGMRILALETGWPFHIIAVAEMPAS